VVVATATSSIHKVTVDKGLSSCMGEGSIATQIGEAKHSREILTSALVRVARFPGRRAQEQFSGSSGQSVGRWRRNRMTQGH
jgi:hypothetical protein